MSASLGKPTGESAAPLSREEFDAMANRLEVDADVRGELYPMVRDLLSFADTLNRLAPELGQDIDIAKLTSAGT